MKKKEDMMFFTVLQLLATALAENWSKMKQYKLLNQMKSKLTQMMENIKES